MNIESLIIPKSAGKPGATLFTNGDCYLYGDSRSEELDEFYTRISNFIKNLVTDKIPVNFIFYFSYFNTITQRYIYDLFFILDAQEVKGSVIWYYDEDDETILEMGSAYKDMFPSLKMKLKEKKKIKNK